MAHVQTGYLKLWKPQDLSVDKFSSQKMCVDNIEAMENFAKVTMQKIHHPVKAISDLRAIDTSDTTLFTDGMLIIVQENGMYSFNRSAIGGNGADGNAVIAPITGGGGWVPTTPTDIPLSGREASTPTELDSILTSTLSNMSNNTIKYIIMNCTQPFAPFGGGIINMTIYKTNDRYAVIEARAYYTDAVMQFTRSRYNDVWMGWHKLPYLDANNKIPLDQIPSGVLPASVE